MSTAGNVSTSKPGVNGAVFYAPAGTALPTDATTALANTYIALGYVSEDGLRNNNSPESEQIKAWGGDVVCTPLTGKEDTFSFTLIESTNIEVLKLVYGSANVTGTLSTGLEVEANASAPASHVFVFEMLLKDGGVKRIAVPSGFITEVGEITYADGDAIGYDITINCLPDSSGNTHVEFIKRA